MLGAIFGGLASLASSAMGMGAQNAANAINWRSVMETVRSNMAQEQLARELGKKQLSLAEKYQDQQYDLSTADRVDALGNRVYYDPQRGWLIELSDGSARQLSAEQREQLLNLNEDMPRARAAAKRQDERSKVADEEWLRRFNEYKYKPKASEEAEVGKALEKLTRGRQRGLDESASMLARVLARQGDTAGVDRVMRQAREGYSESLTDIIAQSEELGSKLYRDKLGADQGLAQDDLNFLRSTADTTGAVAPNYTSTAAGLTGTAEDALSKLAAALGSGYEAVAGATSQGGNRLLETMMGGSNALQKAYGQYAQGVANTSMDLSGLAKIFAGLGGAGKPEKEYFPPRPGQSNGLW